MDSTIKKKENLKTTQHTEKLNNENNNVETGIDMKDFNEKCNALRREYARLLQEEIRILKLLQ